MGTAWSPRPEVSGSAESGVGPPRKCSSTSLVLTALPFATRSQGTRHGRWREKHVAPPARCPPPSALRAERSCPYATRPAPRPHAARPHQLQTHHRAHGGEAAASEGGAPVTVLCPAQCPGAAAGQKAAARLLTLCRPSHAALPPPATSPLRTPGMRISSWKEADQTQRPSFSVRPDGLRDTRWVTT